MYHKKKRSLINLPMLLRVSGWLMMIESLFMLIPMGTCLYFRESDWLPFAATAWWRAICVCRGSYV